MAVVATLSKGYDLDYIWTHVDRGPAKDPASRRGKTYRARTGSVNVLSGAPFGYRYVRKTDLAGAAYEIVGDQAVLVAEMFRRYADDGASIADLARWLTGQGVATRTGR